MFDFYFWTIYKKIFNFGFLAYSLKITFIFELIPCPLSLLQQVQSLLKVIIRSYRVGFESFICHYAYIPYPLLTLGWLLWPRTMVFNHFYPVYIIFLPWIEPPFHEHPSLEHFVVFWYSCRIFHRIRGAFLAIFHIKMSLILVSF